MTLLRYPGSGLTRRLPRRPAVRLALCLLAAGASLTMSVVRGEAPPRADYRVQREFAVGGAGGWDYLTVDPTAGRLYVSRSDRVMVLSTQDGRLIKTIPDTPGVHGIALAPDLGRGFTSNGRSDSVTVFDLPTLAVVATFHVPGHNPDAILYDSASRRLFTFNGRSQDISILDPVTGQLLASLPAGGKPEFAAGDGTGRVFVNIEDTGKILVIDSRNAKVLATWQLPHCEEPTGLALDAAHARLFSVCGNGVMAVTDAGNGRHVAEVPIGEGPDAVAFDDARGLVFSANGQSGTLTVIHEDDADHFTVAQNLITRKSARTLALDDRSHRIYVVAAAFGEAPPPSAAEPHPRRPVIDGSFEVIELGN